MKKIEYQAPKMEVVEMKTQKFLCGSEIGGGGGRVHAREFEMDDEE